MMTSVLCNDPAPRRRSVRAQGRNGIDYVEVSDDQRTLHVHLFATAPATIAPENIRITGGRRVRDIQVVEVRLCLIDDEELDDCIQVTVDRPGDFSTYTVRLVAGSGDTPFEGFDPRFAQADFSFKVDCMSDLDCVTETPCPPPLLEEPEINYLAKDYASFRRLILDRLALLVPDWQERHVPDLGITLVELLAYVGDHLSYYQDAVATEAYLDTARERISVRRHARLVDYPMHEGCNARAWLCVETEGDQPFDLNGIAFITDVRSWLPQSGTLLAQDARDTVPHDRYEVFEPVRATPDQLYAAHNTIRFYTWGERDCILPCGATAATLRDGEPQPPPRALPAPRRRRRGAPEPEPAKQEVQRQLHLGVGDELIFEEVLGPRTGQAADADRAHRHAVRLTRVTPGMDDLFSQPVVEIAWAPADALPFSFCLSTVTDAPDCTAIEDVSVARGNVLLIDHGKTVDEELGTVQAGQITAPCAHDGCWEVPVDVAQPFRPPPLSQAPLTFREPSRHGPASGMLAQDPRRTMPDIQVTGAQIVASPAPAAHDHAPRGQRQAPAIVQRIWHSRRDLLASQREDRHFVVEMDNDGFAHLRFGDGDSGKMPSAGTTFTARYRVGNGIAGNVGAETITHLVTPLGRTLDGIVRVRNPFPASGGTPPEPLAEVKVYAPGAFRTRRERAITADDYARLAETHRGVQRAAATLRWNGSWYTVRVALDPLGGEQADAALLAGVERLLYPYRRIGYDLELTAAEYVPLTIAMRVCVAPDQLRGHVKASLLERFSNRLLPSGQRGYFHPDNLTFGDRIALSKLVAAAQAVPGVGSVEQLTIATTDTVYVWPDSDPADPAAMAPRDPVVRLGSLQIAQMDNDPSLPENGTFTLDLRGGR